MWINHLCHNVGNSFSPNRISRIHNSIFNTFATVTKSIKEVTAIYLIYSTIVSITYFVPDVRKDGGSYTTVIGTVKRIDTYEKSVVMTDGNIIPIEDILQIESEIFESFNE